MANISLVHNTAHSFNDGWLRTPHRNDTVDAETLLARDNRDGRGWRMVSGPRRSVTVETVGHVARADLVSTSGVGHYG